jgi:hypothetical protein
LLLWKNEIFSSQKFLNLETTHHPKQVVFKSNSLAEKVPRDPKNSSVQYSFFGGFKRNGAGSNEVCKFAYFLMAVPILVSVAFF